MWAECLSKFSWSPVHAWTHQGHGGHLLARDQSWLWSMA
jgi:hypothetical protein